MSVRSAGRRRWSSSSLLLGALPEQGVATDTIIFLPEQFALGHDWRNGVPVIAFRQGHYRIEGKDQEQQKENMLPP
jgi:hypothetical protein